MKTLPCFTYLLALAWLPAAETPAGDAPVREPQVQRPQRDRANATNANNGDTRGQRQIERPQITPGISGWVYIPPQGGQTGPIPPKPDFTPGQGSPEAPKNIRGNQPQGNNQPNGQNSRNAGTSENNNSQRSRSPLTPDEQHKLQTAMEKIHDDAAVKEAREAVQKARQTLEEAARKERTQTEEAALKADPSLGPILEKMRLAANGTNQPRRGDQAPNRPEGQAR